MYQAALTMYAPWIKNNYVSWEVGHSLLGFFSRSFLNNDQGFNLPLVGLIVFDV